ncbi:nitroreductase family deazaflavin-dependent oxidoreductase [Micromonospora sp. ATA32]|nr:nitroreductase family deazaflavin-dependent oxidoreductase [Micromonospora sp. ATA32]
MADPRCAGGGAAGGDARRGPVHPLPTRRRASAGLTRGRVVALGLIPSLVITTVGRRSGQPRSNPLLYVPDGDAYVVIGSNWGQAHQPGWAMNLLSQLVAEVDVKGRRIPVRAEVATGAERERLWQLLVTEWPAYRTYVQRAGGREIRIFRLVPVGRGDAGAGAGE